MKWSSQQFTLPILLGISLTSVSIAVIYLLYKKDEEDSTSRRSHINVPKRVSLECEVPRQFVPAVIGRGGCVIKDVQNKTGTQIHFKEDNLECPERICIIRGPYENTQLAQELIKSIIANQPIIETYETYVPHKACARIIGRGGESVQQIQTISGAKVIVESGYASYVQNVERRIIIKGTAEQIAAALSQIEEKVREFREENTDDETAKKKSCSKLETFSAARLPIQTTEYSQSTESLSLQGTDGTMEVYVSAMESPTKFWVQIVGRGTTALDKLVSEMTAYYSEEKNRELHKLKDITPGQVCAAKFNFDEQWYRAYVISVAHDDRQCGVFFMDYGDHDVIEFDNILELRTDFLSLRMQAMECCLNNVKPRQGEWSIEACDKFAELTWVAQWNVLVAKIEGYKDRTRSYGGSKREVTVYCLDLFDRSDDKDINVALELINEGFADAEEPLLLSSRSTSRPSSAASIEKKISTKTPANTSNKMDSSNEILSSTLNTTINLETSEEINMATPKKPVGQIEEIDLVTPVRNETEGFIEHEEKAYRENGSGDYQRNGSSGNRYNRSYNSSFKTKGMGRIAPAGYESDLSDDSNELELG
ncbi:tudor and KH domain containing protein papi isoform X2 [Halictus rubicundus]|uniref:tudor and KH domain containing protein papi isoform X2 n=1 Tax=Halictus rubicundus TaxID=77578 RepID=UPI004036B4A1